MKRVHQRFANLGAFDLRVLPDTNMRPVQPTNINEDMTMEPSHTHAQPNGILDLYASKVTGYDELLGNNNVVRDHWTPVVQFLDTIGAQRGNALYDRIQRRIVENGLSLDSYSDPTNATQPWKLDLIPLIMSRGEWQFIERGVKQRAEILDIVLADLYGEQTYLSDGSIPSTLIHADPAYLKPLHGTKSARSGLTFFAVDLAKDDTGLWRVIDSHAETIAGHGYALANRVVLADINAQLFRSCNAQRISHFYNSVSEYVTGLASGDDPTLAILGPDPEDETYLSHAYVARYFGYPLLTGLDLRISKGRAFLKTLSGLQAVDVLLRAVPAANCDPLELDPDGYAGPAGLVHAVRQNPELVVNALGTAIVENRGLAPFLPNLSQRILEQDLAIPDAPRVWLGDQAPLEAIVSNPDDYIVRRSFEGTARPGHAHHGRRLSLLSSEDRRQFINELKLNGAQYVAERPSSFATAPSWTPTGVEPKPYALRVFAAKVDGEFSVMPGGLALNVDGADTVALSSSSSVSRDVWVASENKQGPHYSRWRISDERTQSFGGNLPSRLADNLYWLGRNVERADWTLRVMRSALNLGDEELRSVRRADSASQALDVLINFSEDSNERAQAEKEPLEDRVKQLLYSSDLAYGLSTTFRHIRRLVQQTRNRLSIDSWRLLNTLSVHPYDDTEYVNTFDNIDEILNRHLSSLSAFNGMTHENMTRNFGWRFLDIGRRIERALQSSKLLQALLVEPLSDAEETDRLVYLLETTDSFMTYRARYRFAPSFPLVLDLLMIDEKNPRSVAFQLISIRDHIAALPMAADDAMREPEQRAALDLLSKVQLSDPVQLRNSGENRSRVALNDLLQSINTGLPKLSDTISSRYFSHTDDDRPHRVHTRLMP